MYLQVGAETINYNLHQGVYVFSYVRLLVCEKDDKKNF